MAREDMISFEVVFLYMKKVDNFFPCCREGREPVLLRGGRVVEVFPGHVSRKHPRQIPRLGRGPLRYRWVSPVALPRTGGCYDFLLLLYLGRLQRLRPLHGRPTYERL